MLIQDELTGALNNWVQVDVFLMHIIKIIIIVFHSFPKIASPFQVLNIDKDEVKISKDQYS